MSCPFRCVVIDCFGAPNPLNVRHDLGANRSIGTAQLRRPFPDKKPL
jgi:hypothetical protein